MSKDDTESQPPRMASQQYDLLLNGMLALGAGQRHLTKLHIQMAKGFNELAEASAEQEEQLDLVIEALRAMGDTSSETQKRLSTIEADIEELKKKAS